MEKTPDNQVNSIPPGRTAVCRSLYWSCWKGNKWALRLPKVNLVKEAKTTRCAPQELDVLCCWCTLSGTFTPGGRQSTVQQTVFVFQLEQFTSPVTVFRTCQWAVSRRRHPDRRHLETPLCLNWSDCGEPTGTTKLRALRSGFVINRCKKPLLTRAVGLKRAGRSLSLEGKTCENARPSGAPSPFLCLWTSPALFSESDSCSNSSGPTGKWQKKT